MQNGLSQQPITVQEAHINYALGQRDGVCYPMPHEAAEVMSAFADGGEWREERK